MREILFRGRDTHGVWQYGDYIRYDDEMCNITDTTIYRHAHLCYTETVGQYTGLTDKNGTKIFEGDILEHRWNFYDHEYISRGIVVNKEWDCGCCYSVFGFTADIVDNYRILDLCDHDKSVVIGNIHDNPELVKESEK